ncbi:hypothetical protein MKX01_030140 [Papaver californicum]|nr:hypothetical protein MKX01_030140 [Papaver californicum]
MATQTPYSKIDHQPLLDQNDNQVTKRLATSSSSRKISYLLLSFHCFPILYDGRFHSKASCLAMLNESINGDELIGKSSVPSGKSNFLQIFLEKYVSRICSTMEVIDGFNRLSNNLKEQEALRNCIELIDSSIDRVNDSVEALKKHTRSNHELLDGARTWLSVVLTNHVTCLDGLFEVSELGEARVSLAMIAEISPSSSSNEETTGWLASKTLQLPPWVTMKDQKLLETLPNVSVQEAITAAPDNSKTRYVIHLKKGKKNLMIVGDGIDAMIITGSLNFIDGTSTFNSAIVVVQGDGFRAQDICFQNTAGPEKHQAVAIRIKADQRGFSRCKFDAYQDTLYAHSLRHFYRDCSIMGTVDFILGNAAMVVQNSKVIARKPMKNQNNMFTGISIQYCNVITSSDLEPVKGSFKTFLGRPWKAYARTVYMESSLGDLINPAGWAEWNSSNPFTKTLWVKWPGYHVMKNPAEAKKFTVAELIQGNVRLKSTRVAFTEGL